MGAGDIQATRHERRRHTTVECLKQEVTLRSDSVAYAASRQQQRNNSCPGGGGGGSGGDTRRRES